LYPEDSTANLQSTYNDAMLNLCLKLALSPASFKSRKGSAG